MTETIEIIMSPTDYDITVVVEPTQVTILSEGAQGPQGPPGPSGVAFQHVQSVAASTWSVNHNLGRPTGIELYTLMGDQIFADVSIETLSFDTTTITFPSPLTGYAVFT